MHYYRTDLYPLPEIATMPSLRGCYYLFTCFLCRFSIPEYVLKTYSVWVLIGYGIDLLCMETTQAFVGGCAADKCGCNRLFVYTYPRMLRGTPRSSLSVSCSYLSIRSGERTKTLIPTSDRGCPHRKENKRC